LQVPAGHFIQQPSFIQKLHRKDLSDIAHSSPGAPLRESKPSPAGYQREVRPT
jgi:hypothetical protein